MRKTLLSYGIKPSHAQQSTNKWKRYASISKELTRAITSGLQDETPEDPLLEKTVKHAFANKETKMGLFGGEQKITISAMRKPRSKCVRPWTITTCSSPAFY